MTLKGAREVWRAPAIALVSALLASWVMWAQGEVDAYAPALLGVCLWSLWRLSSGLLNLLCTAPLALGGAFLLLERSEPHLIFSLQEARWREGSESLSLKLCALLLALSLLARLLERPSASPSSPSALPLAGAEGPQGAEEPLPAESLNRAPN